MVEQVCCAFILGIAIGGLYDLFRLIRYVTGKSFICDVLFWIISSFLVFSYFISYNDGNIRGLFLLTAFCGFLIYISTVGCVFNGMEIKFSRKIKNRLKMLNKKLKSFKKVLQSRYCIYYNILKAKLMPTYLKEDVENGKDQQFKD